MRIALTKLGILILLGTSVWCQPSSGKLAAIDELAATYVRSGKIPGLAVGVMYKSEILLAKGYGLANVEQNTPVTPATVFRINSMTKQFTAAGILLLAERGLLRTDSHLSEFVPEFPRATEITIQQLLTHTAGLSTYDAKPDVRVFTLQRHSIAEMVQWILQDPFLADPGTKWEYSNSGYLLLARVIEKISGQTYAVFMQRNIFDKLQLTQTAIDDEQAIVLHRAAGYMPVEGKPGELRNAPIPAAGSGGGGASAHSTVSDMLHWHQALFHGQLLKPPSFAEMTRPARLSNGDVVVTTRIVQGAQYGYGLVIADFKGHPRIGHTGTGAGFHSMIMTYPADQYTIVVLSNINGRPTPFAADIEKAIAEILLGP